MLDVKKFTIKKKSLVFMFLKYIRIRVRIWFDSRCRGREAACLIIVGTHLSKSPDQAGFTHPRVAH